MNFKKNDGIASSDALIAVLIITLFAGLIASISYNLYLANSSVKRMSKATSYIVDMFEYIDKNYYDDVDEVSELVTYFNTNENYNQDAFAADNQNDLNESNKNYKVLIEVSKYNQLEENIDQNLPDLVEEVTINVTYKLGGKDQTIEMTKTKSRENIDTPNKPDFGLLELEDGYTAYPIKKTNSSWIVCDRNDLSWYDYKSGRWAATYITTKSLNINDKVDVENIDDEEEIQVWIPRFAYDADNTDEKILFLFSNTNKYIQNTDSNDGYNELEDVNTSIYEISNEFGASTGIWTTDIENGTANNLDSVYPLKK